nr:MAG TPA: hypothetical protein [Caudoviricetes sp.]
MSSIFFNLTNWKGIDKMTTIKATFIQVIRFRLSEFFKRNKRRTEAKACTMQSI